MDSEIIKCLENLASKISGLSNRGLKAFTRYGEDEMRSRAYSLIHHEIDRLKKESTPMQVWIVGRLLNYETSSWEFVGVFDSEEKTREACVEVVMFVGPATMNVRMPLESEEWPGCYYPHALVKEESE